MKHNVLSFTAIFVIITNLKAYKWNIFLNIHKEPPLNSLDTGHIEGESSTNKIKLSKVIDTWIFLGFYLKLTHHT